MKAGRQVHRDRVRGPPTLGEPVSPCSCGARGLGTTSSLGATGVGPPARRSLRGRHARSGRLAALSAPTLEGGVAVIERFGHVQAPTSASSPTARRAESRFGDEEMAPAGRGAGSRSSDPRREPAASLEAVVGGSLRQAASSRRRPGVRGRQGGPVRQPGLRAGHLGSRPARRPRRGHARDDARRDPRRAGTVRW